jgi:hypothetical protein
MVNLAEIHSGTQQVARQKPATKSHGKFADAMFDGEEFSA